MNSLFQFSFMGLLAVPLVLLLSDGALVQNGKRNYVAISSGNCIDIGLRPLYELEECERAASILGFKWDWQVDELSSYQDLTDGCSIRDERQSTGNFALFAQRRGSCEKGSRAPDWVPELYGRASCECSRSVPCICAIPTGILPCKTGKVGSIPVLDYNGKHVGDKKYCISGGR